MTKLETAARAMLDAFGGDVPDWLRKEADALGAALDAPEPARVLITVQGATIQDVSQPPGSPPAVVMVCDFDDPQEAGPRMREVNGEGGDWEAAWVTTYGDGMEADAIMREAVWPQVRKPAAVEA